MEIKIFAVGNMLYVNTPRREISEHEFYAWLGKHNPEALVSCLLREQEKDSIRNTADESEPEHYWDLAYDDPRRGALEVEYMRWKKNLNRKLKAVNQKYKYPNTFDYQSAHRQASKAYGTAEAKFFGTIRIKLDNRYTWDKERLIRAYRFLEIQLNINPLNLCDHHFVKAGAALRVLSVDFIAND